MHDNLILGAGAGLGGAIGGAVAPGVAALKTRYTPEALVAELSRLSDGSASLADVINKVKNVAVKPYKTLRTSAKRDGLVKALQNNPEIAAQMAGGATAGGTLGLDLAQRHVDANNTIMKRLGRLIGRHPIAAGAAGLGALGLGAYGLMNHDSGSITDKIRAREKRSAMLDSTPARYAFGQAVQAGIVRVSHAN